MNVFAIATNDQSVYYLGRIFGQVGTVLPGTGPIILSTMFKAFNTAILGIGALIVTYTTVVGILNTAAEGEFLGKHWHSIWVPLRTVIGIAGLFPMKSGYCALQVIIMWVILQGVGAADSVWNAAINYFRAGGSITVPSPVKALSDTGVNSGNFVTLFQSLICEAGARQLLCGKSVDASDPACKPNSLMSRISCPQGANGGVCTLVFGPKVYGSQSTNPICGALQWDTSQPVGQGQDQVYRSILPTFATIANFYVNNSQQELNYLAYLDAIKNGNATTQPVKPGQGYPAARFDEETKAHKVDCDQGCLWTNVIYPYAGSNFIADAASAYQGYLNNTTIRSPAPGAGNVISSTATGLVNPAGALAGVGALVGGYAVDINKTLDMARDNGWIFAGGYFYFISTMTNSKINETAKNATMQIAGPDTQGIDEKSPRTPGEVGPSQITKWVTQAKGIAQQAPEQESGKMGGAAKITSNSLGGAGDVLIGILSGGLAPAIVAMFMATIGDVGSESQQSPVVVLQAFGETLLVITQILFFLVGTAIFTGTLIGAIGSCMNPTGFAITNISAYLLPALFFLFFALFTFGATLAVYVPLIPYIIFTMGAIGWMISTVEAMVAAPIVALGIMHPEGQHQIWGKAEHGVLLLMNIFLRPTLMVFGLIAGMLMSYVVVTLINAAFLNVMRQIYSGPGLVETVLFLAAYCGLVITSLNKCFSLIHLLPEKVLGWIGGRGEAFGEGEAAKEVGGKVGSAAGGITSTSRQATKTGGAQEKMLKKAKEADEIGAEPPEGRGRSGGIGGGGDGG